MRIYYDNVDGEFFAVSEFSEKNLCKSAGFLWDRGLLRWSTDNVDKAADLYEFADDKCKKIIEENAHVFQKPTEEELPLDERLYFFFDTETSGFPSFELDSGDDRQPAIMQIAFMLTDARGKELMCYKSLIYPEKEYKVFQGALEAHGITYDDCKKFGILHDDFDDILLAILEHKPSIVAHNIGFDLFMLQVAGFGFPIIDKCHDRLCTMKMATPIMQLPKTSFKGEGEYGWPNLSCAYEYFIGGTLDNAHDALADVRACKEIFFSMRNGERKE